MDKNTEILKQIARSNALIQKQLCCNASSNSATPTPQIDKEINYVEDLTTGFLNKVINTWIDGVLQPEVVIATILKVRPLQHDFEYVCDTVTGFLQQIENIINADGTVTTNTTATTIGCLETPATFAKVTIDELDCAGTVIATAQEAYQTKILNKVNTNLCNVSDITTPIVAAIKSKKDYEPLVLCDTATGNPVIVTYSYDDTGLLTTTRISPDGTTFVGTTGQCPEKKKYDYEKETICVDGLPFTKWFILDNSLAIPTIISTFWLNDLDQIVAAPLATLINNVNCQAKQEVDYIHTNWLPFCVDGVQWYVGEEYSFNNITATKTYIGKIYKQGALGIPTQTAPTGTVILDGVCKDCKIDKFFEFGYYKTIGGVLNDTFLGLQNNVNADFNSPIGGNYEVYFVIDGVQQFGNGVGVNYGADYPVQFTTLQSIADYFNNHAANTTPKDKWVVDNTVGLESLFIQGTQAGASSNHNWTSMVVAHYNGGTIDFNHFKTDPTNITTTITLPDTCRKIEILKELDCNDNLTLKGFEINGTIINSFDTTLVFNEDVVKSERKICINTTTNEIWNVLEKTETSPCGIITTKYFDDDVTPIKDVTDLFQSIRHSGECNCCEDNFQPSILKASFQTYGGSVFGSRIFATTGFDKFAEWQLQWQVKVYKNGSVIFTSPLSPTFTSQANSETWLNSVCGTYITLDTFNGATVGRNILSLPSNSLTDEYLIVLTETGTGNSPNIGVPNLLIDYAFTNKATSFGVGSDLADCFGNNIDWSNRAGWSWFA